MAADEILDAAWAKEHAEVDRRVALGIASHSKSEDHSSPRGLVLFGCDFGVPGTLLTQTGIWGHREIAFPMEASTWALMASPAAGSAVVDVLKAATLAAFNAGTYASVCGGSLPTLSSQRANAGDALGVWPIVDWLPGEVLVWQLVSVSGGIEVLSVQANMRRT
jgi:hypothetical protein